MKFSMVYIGDFLIQVKTLSEKAHDLESCAYGYKTYPKTNFKKVIKQHKISVRNL